MVATVGSGQKIRERKKRFLQMATAMSGHNSYPVLWDNFVLYMK